MSSWASDLTIMITRLAEMNIFLTMITARRRSNVVKEVEKLQKKREERRAKQAEQKVQREELMNLDPGNPNWEFLAMIRYATYSRTSRAYCFVALSISECGLLYCREYRMSFEMRPLQDGDPIEDHQITVCVRKRPLNKKGE